MNKTELIDSIARLTSRPKSDVNQFLNTFVDVVTDELRSGGRVTLVGFLTLKKARREGRVCINPNGGADIQIPPKNVIKVKAGKKLQDAVNDEEC